MLKVWTLFLGLIASNEVLLAQAPKPPPNPGQERPGLTDDWKRRLRGANEHLKASRWKKGKGIAESVLTEMRNRIAGGEGTAPLLAVGLLYRAIGESGLGEAREAAWDFGAAQYFYPDYSRVDLTPYGEAGKPLDAWRRIEATLTAPSTEGPLEQGKQKPDERGAEIGPITRPKKIRGEEPSYPHAKNAACIDGPILVESVINQDGFPSFPHLITSKDPVLAMAVLEAFREWRFEPAHLEGKPVRVYYRLTINFGLRYC